MPASLNKFINLRVYKSMTTLNILNSIICNRIMKFPSIVRQSRNIYDISSKLLSKKFVDYIITNTFCKTLTAGNTLEEANRVSDYFRKHNIPVILDYCAQGQIGHALSQNLQQANSLMFAKSAECLKVQKNQMISIKITGLINVPTLKILNDAVIMRDIFWLENNQNGKLTAQKLFNGLQKIYLGLTEQQFVEYVKKIHNYQGDIQKLQVDEIDFKMNHHPFYLYENHKNQDFVIRLFFPTNSDQMNQCKNLVRRINQILQPQADNKNGFRILVDAEQSYVQRAIEVFSEQMQAKFNKDKVYIIPTIQNYLKRSVQRTQFQIEIAKRRNLKFGAKLVRGAYIVEETKIAQKNKVPNPIVENFQKTTQNYLQSFQLIVKSFDEGEVIVASHNQDTINQTKTKYLETGSKMKLSFAQLLGLADHLTWKVNAEKYTVYKYLPWAKTEIMIPYMIRRAEQLNQMRYPLDTQYELLKNQLRQRFLN